MWGDYPHTLGVRATSHIDVHGTSVKLRRHDNVSWERWRSIQARLEGLVGGKLPRAPRPLGARRLPEM